MGGVDSLRNGGITIDGGSTSLDSDVGKPKSLSSDSIRTVEPTRSRGRQRPLDTIEKGRALLTERVGMMNKAFKGFDVGVVKGVVGITKTAGKITEEVGVLRGDKALESSGEMISSVTKGGSSVAGIASGVAGGVGAVLSLSKFVGSVHKAVKTAHSAKVSEEQAQRFDGLYNEFSKSERKDVLRQAMWGVSKQRQEHVRAKKARFNARVDVAKTSVGLVKDGLLGGAKSGVGIAKGIASLAGAASSTTGVLGAVGGGLGILTGGIGVGLGLYTTCTEIKKLKNSTQKKAQLEQTLLHATDKSGEEIQKAVKDHAIKKGFN